MGSASELLAKLLEFPDEERTRIAIALLESVETFDPHASLTDVEFAAEMERRAEEAALTPSTGLSWEELRAQLRRDSND